MTNRGSSSSNKKPPQSAKKTILRKTYTRRAAGKVQLSTADKNNQVFAATVGGALIGNLIAPGIGGAIIGGLVGAFIGNDSVEKNQK